MRKPNHIANFSIKILSLFFKIVLCLSATYYSEAQIISPLQTGHYTPAAQGVRDMSNPVPGLFPIWYNMYATSNTFVDLDGNEITNVNQIFPNAPSRNISYDLKAYAAIPMIFWASNKISFLGNANYMGGVAFNYMTADVSFKTDKYWQLPDSTVTRSGSGNVSGMSDMFFIPLGLSWGGEHADFTFLYGFAAPTGRFDIDADDNVGLGFWTNQFQGFGYYYPVADKSTALMLGMTYELNGKIKDSDVKPGSRYSLEYGLSQYVSGKIELYAQGGHNWQVGDDMGDGVYWDPSRHDKKSTAAFGVTYWIVPEKLFVSGKYGFDYGARGRGLSNYYMLNFLYIPNILTGGN